MIFDFATLPIRSSLVTAHLVYVNGATQPSYAIIVGVNGYFKMTGKQWLLMQLLQRSSTRFV